MQPPPREQLAIYPAAALFNARETLFNTSLVQELERRHGYRTHFPQRDGFEFADLFGALQEVLPAGTPASEIQEAVQLIIYYLDMGLFLASSDVVVANLDESLDEGVIVEVSYARLMGKPVVGLRTDVRTPFGSAGDTLGGVHFFPALQSHEFLTVHLPGNLDPTKAEEQFRALSDAIDDSIRGLVPASGAPLPSYALQNPEIKQLLEGAELLFHGLRIGEINTNEGIQLVVDRYVKSRQSLAKIFPRVR